GEERPLPPASGSPGKLRRGREHGRQCQRKRIEIIAWPIAVAAEIGEQDEARDKGRKYQVVKRDRAVRDLPRQTQKVEADQHRRGPDAELDQPVEGQFEAVGDILGSQRKPEIVEGYQAVGALERVAGD